MKSLDLLLSILNHSSQWSDIYKEILNYNSSQKKLAGKMFEEFCKYYYLTEPAVKHDYKHVWLFSETPLSVKEKLNLGKIDHGIDLVLEGHDDTFSVVQCKFRSDQNSNLSWTKDNLANLFADGDLSDYYIIFTNSSGIDKHSLSKKNNRLKLISLGELINISSSTINEMKDYINGKTVKTITVKKPREDQRIAIENVLKGLRNNDRGQLILPCAAGKTLTSLWIKEKLNSKHTLVLVPSLALLRQTKNEWIENSNHFTPYICVCSETDIDKNQDTTIVHTYEISGKVSTNPDEIRNFLNDKNETIVYSTYQSLGKIQEAIKESSFIFDLAICDEAHKTSGCNLSKYGLIHFDNNIPVKKRLYMTATPRILSENLKATINPEVLEYIHDMSNSNVFGPELYRMSFKEAIDQGILVDYQIIAIGIENKEIGDAIQQRKYVSDHETIDEIANNFALEKFMRKYNPTHAITFHSSIKKAKLFQTRHKILCPEINTLHINGELTTNDRNVLIKSFKESSKSIITNARCLTEGIDVPAVDIVYFCDPKNTTIDIVQAAGRSLRKHPGKKLGYILVPIFHSEKERIEDFIDTGRFKNLITVIRALSSHDERLINEINMIKIGLGKENNKTRHILIDSLNLITLHDFNTEIKETLFHQIIDKIRTPWRNFLEARTFVHSLGLKKGSDWVAYCKSGNKPVDIPSDIPGPYKNQGWISMGDWLGSGIKASFYKIFRPYEEGKKYVHSLNLKTQGEWHDYVKSGNKPEDIPSGPSKTYKNKGWISWGDWLGTNSIASFNRKFRPFIEGKKFAHSLNLKNGEEWSHYCKSNNKPEDIPANPQTVYRNVGWTSMGDWLGTGTIANYHKTYRAFEKARIYVRSLKLSGEKEWRIYSKSPEKPADIPADPSGTYKNKGWTTWGDWLGTGTIANYNKKYRLFEKAREFIHTLHIKNQKEWIEYTKSGKLPSDIPTSPARTYKNAGWVSLGDWLGTKNISNNKRNHQPFEQARSHVHSLKLKTLNEWRNYCKSSNKPIDIPATPDRIYKDKGWISWSDWFGI